MPDIRIDRELYRNPSELCVDKKPISRWLVIGSCLAAGFVDFVRNLPDGSDGDYIVYNNGAALPLSPPSDISSYDCQMIQISMRSIVPDLAHARISIDDIDAFEKLFEESIQRMEYALNNAMVYVKNGEIPTFVPNLIVPQQGSLGRLVGKRDLRNFSYFVQQLNDQLSDFVARLPNAYVIDFDDIIRTFGAKYFQDDVLWQYNHAAALTDNDYSVDQERMHPPRPVSEYYTLKTSEYVHALWEETKSQYITVTRKGAVKLVIFDLDDTLWRGVVAEQDHPNPHSVEGWPLGMAETVLLLKQRGIVVSIVSKNDETRIRDIWDTMWSGRLRLSDFASIKINWKSKADNVAEVIKEVNVLPDSVVFVDDNPVERHIVQSAFPGIRAIGDDLYSNRRILLWSAETQPIMLTEESARRNEMVKSQIERDSFRKTLSRDEFIASLDVQFTEVIITTIDNPKFSRAFELLNKTNQFNSSGQRWTISEIAEEISSGMHIFAFEVGDRFTQYGLVGMALVKDQEIKQFVMSCRVIGLDVELECLNRLKLRNEKLSAKYIANSKNFLCKDLFEKSGFIELDNQWVWEA